MTARKIKRNARSVKGQGRFQISRNAVVNVAAAGRDFGEDLGLPRVFGSPLLFAIARDACTIFASWSIDWKSVFEKMMPVDRQVHLRVCSEDGSEEQRIAVEPMAWMHYVTTSQLHGAYRLDIGYYQPADVWHSIAISNDVVMPRNKIAEDIDVDLATIPFHLSFQQLLDSLRAESDVACASVISRFQKHALSNGKEALTAEETEILEKLDVPLAEIAKEWRVFDQTRCEQRSGALIA